MNDLVIDTSLAVKVLEVVDAGLASGIGNPIPGQMCVEAAVNFAMGSPHGDNPSCVSQALRMLKIRLNDSRWSTRKVRAKGMRRLALAQLGSAGVLDEKEFAKRVVTLAIQVSVPQALRSSAGVCKDESKKQAMLDAGRNCEDSPTRENALKASSAAYGAAAYAAASAAAASAASNATHAAVRAGHAAYGAADAAASAATTAKAGRRDQSLADFCERVVQILIEMKAPGCQWLYLTEQPSD